MYLARFYLDPSRLTIGTGSILTIFTGLDTSNDIFRIQLQKLTTKYQIRTGITYDAGTWTDGVRQDINTGWTAVEVKWEAMEDNGYFSLWIDGGAKGMISPVDNGSLRVDSVRLGVLSVSGRGTVGTLYFDDFESRNNIGILPDPGVEEPEPVTEPGWKAVKYKYDTQKPHAVSTLSSGESYTYDANENMTQKVINNITWDYAYTAENRLASITDGTTTWLFSYDGMVARHLPGKQEPPYVGLAF